MMSLIVWNAFLIFEITPMYAHTAPPYFVAFFFASSEVNWLENYWLTQISASSGNLGNIKRVS